MGNGGTAGPVSDLRPPTADLRAAESTSDFADGFPRFHGSGGEMPPIEVQSSTFSGPLIPQPSRKSFHPSAVPPPALLAVLPRGGRKVKLWIMADVPESPANASAPYGVQTALWRTRTSRADQAVVARAASFLRESGAHQVWLFGSLARGLRPTVHSDFDFAVEGLPRDRYLGCLGHLLQLAPRPVDLVEIETCSELMRERIAKDGILIGHED